MGVKVVVSALAMMVPAIAAADHPRRTIQADGVAQPYQFVGSRAATGGPTFVRQVLPANGSGALVAQSRVIYLNHDGVELVPGNNDSRTSTSSIVTQPVALSGWAIDDATWADTLDCVQSIYSRFDVTVTDEDPGDMPHIEAVIGGSPIDVGLPDNVAGVSPFTEDCGIIESSIVFTFTDVLPDDSRTVCEVMAQEIAHSFGLDHEMLPSDPMTYLDYDGDRDFQDEDASCGEYEPRMCGLAGHVCRTSQNSVALLGQRLGADAGGPMFGITSPSDGDTVAPGFTVAGAAAPGVQLTMATLYIDGKVAATSTPSSDHFTLAAPDSVAAGTHHVKVVASDGTRVQDQQVDVTVDGGAGGCSAGRGGGGAIGLALVGLLRRRRSGPR